MTRHHPDDDDLAAYSAGRLSPNTAATVERHLIGCSRCRDVVTLGMLVRAEPASTRRKAGRYGLALTATLAAASLAVWISTSRAGSIERFGRIDAAPAYTGIAVRAASNPGDSLFRAGMAAYARRAFPEAASKLKLARQAGADQAATSFFIGVTALMQDSAREAAKELARSAGFKSSPYSTESEYYRAKALIRLGARDSAVAALRSAAASDDAVAPVARALLDSMAGVRGGR